MLAFLMRKGNSNQERKEGAEMRREEAAVACSEMDRVRVRVGPEEDLRDWGGEAALSLVPLVSVMVD